MVAEDPERPTAAHPEIFGLDDEVGRDLAEVDWAATPLGEPATWPQSLQTAVSILLSSRFSMWMAWGPKLTFFCNAAYRRDTLGGKYPWALGRPASEVWAEIWHDIGPRIERVLSTEQATWDEALLLFLERSGYPEETYHTFSYSPLRDDEGRVVGFLCVVSEDTDRVIGERRMATVRDLGSDPSVLPSEHELLAAAAGQLDRNRHDLPFTLVYLIGDDGVARLRATSGMARGHMAAPDTLQPDGLALWPRGYRLAVNQCWSPLIPRLSPGCRQERGLNRPFKRWSYRSCSRVVHRAASGGRVESLPPVGRLLSWFRYLGGRAHRC